MLMLSIANELPLANSDDASDLVTWMEIAIRSIGADDRTRIGTARVALLRIAEAFERGITVREVLDADSQDLLALHEVLFDDDDTLAGEQGTRPGLDVLYFASIDLLLPWRGRRIEEAIVRRVCDVWGRGCAIAVVPFIDADEAARWRKIGFVVAREPREHIGYAYLDLALDHPRLIAADDGNSFATAGE